MKYIFTIFIFMIFSSLAQAQKVSLIAELSIGEIEKIEAGELVLKTQDKSGSAWPEITLYTLVEASPLESMGIFSALDYQKDYVPNVLVSNPIKHISSVEVITQYELRVPFPLSNAHYTHGSIVHQYEKDFELTWYRVSSTSTDEARGSAYFTNYKNKTLFRYRSYIKPKSIFGSLVKKIMLKDVQSTVKAIKDHIEKLKKANSDKIPHYSALITRSLNGEFVYKDLTDKK